MPPPPAASASSRHGSSSSPATSGRSVLQIVMVWRNQILHYELQRKAQRVTIGPSKRATFVTPPVLGGQRRFLLARPQRGAYRVRLAPGMRGEIQQGGHPISIVDVLAGPPGRRQKGDVREVVIEPGDRARIQLREGGDLRIELRFVDEPEIIGPPRHQDPLLRRTMTIATIVLGLCATFMSLLWSKSPPKTMAITAERLVKLEKPIEQEKTASRQRAEKKAEQKKSDEGQVTKAKEKAGKVGRQDAKPKETVIPKGDKDVLREKVAKTGLLGLIGKDKKEGSGLSKLFAESNDVEQAVAGMAGAKMVAGHGSGGLSTSGSGSGGGGTGLGHIYGAGNLDTGGRGSKGHGRGPKLVERGEKEVKVGVGLGTGDMDGSLTREQIDKVVRAHKSGVSYCYEKELQRKATLGGTITIFWSIQPDGTVAKANVKTTSMSDAAVEGCILRQVKQWAFPKAPAQTHVNYPFIFKGGT